MPITDPITQGLAMGWKHLNGSGFTEDQTLEADVVIIGSGAGGGTALEILTKAGLNVIIVEAGPLKSSKDFDMEERNAYPNLYQQSAAMKTADNAIAMLQGRAVGGSTTINWTTSIRTPSNTLDFWQSEKSITGLSDQELTPWFEEMEKRLNIKTWNYPPNQNNHVLQKGCEKLGWNFSKVKRNVKGCNNAGYCGMGCPINAKQSMLVTTIPSALNNGATLLSQVKAVKFDHAKDKIYSVKALALNENAKPTGITVSLKAKHFILAGGAIHTPVLMLRSEAVDPYNLLGKRTFLHPSTLCAAEFDHNIKAHSGAPQSIISDEFLWPSHKQNHLGYKLEVPPVHPMMLASTSLGFGEEHAKFMSRFNHLQACIALIRDGFHEESQGGEVKLTKSGFEVDYPINNMLWQTVRCSYLSMAEIQFAAGAKRILPINDGMTFLNTWAKAKEAILQMELSPRKTVIGSAHIMGGCPMGNDRQMAMVDCFGRSHYLENLSIMDGSLFPSSLGANPQLTIYAITARNATKLANDLS